MPSEISSIVVTGDIVLDRHLYGGERATLGDHSARGTHMKEETGGAFLTYQLIEAVLSADREARLPSSERKVTGASEGTMGSPPQPDFNMCQMGRKLPKDTSAAWPERLIGYAWWEPYQKPSSKDQVWRVSKALGYGPPDTQAETADVSPSFFQIADELPSPPNILVLDDAGDLFRRKEQSALWLLPSDTTQTTVGLPDWIVLKLAGVIGQDDLWDKLMTCGPRDRLVILTSAKLLRQSDVRLSRGLSWERTVEHLLQELERNPTISPLCMARHLIVTFGSDGAIWIDFSTPEVTKAWLVFDAANAEGEWASRIQGEVFGYLSCLTAAAVRTLVSQRNRNENLDFQPAMEQGLSAMRNLREEGHGIALPAKGEFKPGRGFPAERLAEVVIRPTYRFARAEVPWHFTQTATSRPVAWSILASLQNPYAPTPQPLYGFGRQLALRGPSVLAHVPHLRMGKLITAGRDEMETLRSLRRILQAYRDFNSGKKPLSIGVFGAPGSGKSFGVEQLAIGVFGDQSKDSYEGWKEFNLSQFDKPEDLIGAFHQVRDLVLQGFIPVVFWDEFDSQEYKWLQYLLAPMQDGRFQQGQITHTLGKCVFVFAGGTAETFEEFGPKDDVDPDDPHQQDAIRHFSLAKGPDFKSRLDGYLNVLGPNQRLLPAVGRQKREKDDTDIFFPVRRALIIRNALGCKSNDERLEIDAGVLTALLEVSDYKHGARSLNKLLEPLTTARKISRAPLRRSQLPAPNQLALHVNAEEFHDICARDLPFKVDEIIRKLAPAIHETWRPIAREAAYKDGKEPKYDVAFDELPPDMKLCNEAAARRIPEIIALVGLQIVSLDSSPHNDLKRVIEHIEHHLEALAEEEHNGWMAYLHSEGWRFNEIRDDDKRLHSSLRPFNELRESEKERNRNKVRHYPDFAHKAGYEIVFT
jgi:hypothetical protein